MANQEQIRPQQDRPAPEPPVDPAPPAPQAAARKAELDAGIDAVLGDIDEVLESNAEEFVRSFVQKGGQ